MVFDMAKRVISEYIGIVLAAAALVMAYRGFWTAFYPIVLLWYLLYGFVGLASTFNKKRMFKLSEFFLIITLPFLLVPFRKAFYYWIKAMNVIALKPIEVGSVLKALAYTEKVKPASLYTDNNKATFFSFVATLYCGMNNKALARDYLAKAKALPYKEQLSPTIDKLTETLEEDVAE
jgi:hypothetical protein